MSVFGMYSIGSNDQGQHGKIKGTLSTRMSLSAPQLITGALFGPSGDEKSVCLEHWNDFSKSSGDNRQQSSKLEGQ